ncbi:MAG: glycosyltransferase family 2 protein [Gemmatimonadota bacterium]
MNGEQTEDAKERARPRPAAYRALICITTCARLESLQGFLPHFAAFCDEDPRFNLLVALDGTDPAYLRFCDEWEVPLVYSDEREGVGISKNRVLERHPDFDYYFFLDDDVELLDGSVFPAHVDAARATGIHHFSLFQRGGVRKPTGESTVEGWRVVHGMFGGGQFNFFTGEGLRRVGGWHPRFAEFRRWGHTEHSYRFWRAGLAPAPFNVLEDLSESCIWHAPPPVSVHKSIPSDEDELTPMERELIDEELTFFPVTTLSAHHTNGKPFGRLRRLAALGRSPDRYPLLRGRARRRAYSDFFLWKARHGRGAPSRLLSWIRAVTLWPGNPMIRHHLKGLLAGKGHSPPEGGAS